MLLPSTDGKAGKKRHHGYRQERNHRKAAREAAG